MVAGAREEAALEPVGGRRGLGSGGALKRVGLDGRHGLLLGSSDAQRLSTLSRSRSRRRARPGTGTRDEDGQARGWSTAHGTWEPTSGDEDRVGGTSGGSAPVEQIEEVWTARR